MDDPALLPATEIAVRYRRRELSPVDVVEAILGRIDEHDDRLHAFSTVDREGARAAARAAEQALDTGGPTGSLTGIPVSVKDVFLTQGLRTTFGSPVHPDLVPDRDELVVARLREAGAIILGKTNVPELGFGPGTQNRVIGTTRNPWDERLSPSSSSGGSAVAVAAGMGPVSIGGDGGGSVRVPASFCGIVGLKPSFGRVPMYPAARSAGVPETVGFETLEAVGPMTRSVADAALVLEVIAGADPLDRHALPDDRAPFLEPGPVDIKGLRVGVSTDLGDGTPVDPEVRRAVADAARTLSALGACVAEDGPTFFDPARTFLAIVALELGAFRSFVAQHRAEVNERVRSIVDEVWTFEDVSEAIRARRAMSAEVNHFFERYDVLLTPTCPAPPFPVDRPYPEAIDGRPVASAYVMGAFTAPFNLTGNPALSMPVAWTEDGLPIGAQLVGSHLADRLVLRVGRALEGAAPWMSLPAPRLQAPTRLAGE